MPPSLLSECGGGIGKFVSTSIILGGTPGNDGGGGFHIASGGGSFTLDLGGSFDRAWLYMSQRYTIQGNVSASAKVPITINLDSIDGQDLVFFDQNYYYDAVFNNRTVPYYFQYSYIPVSDSDGQRPFQAPAVLFPAPTSNPVGAFPLTCPLTRICGSWPNFGGYYTTSGPGPNSATFWLDIAVMAEGTTSGQARISESLGSIYEVIGVGYTGVNFGYKKPVWIGGSWSETL